jgi:hypothetical protein
MHRSKWHFYLIAASAWARMAFHHRLMRSAPGEVRHHDRIALAWASA